MNFAELKQEIKKVNFTVVREDAESYFEAVFLKDKLAEVSGKLESCLGKPLPAVSKEAATVVEEYGGIMKGQTLYFLKQGEPCIFAMLWPWQDKQSITLKLGCK